MLFLSDYQLSYNGGNAFFKYAEFDEAKNKIFMRTYSPYAATLRPEEKGFFDVNFLNGEGNDDSFNFNFEKRFQGLKKVKRVFLEKEKA